MLYGKTYFKFKEIFNMYGIDVTKEPLPLYNGKISYYITYNRNIVWPQDSVAA